MAEIELKGRYPEDRFRVIATMLFPSDTALREAVFQRQMLGQDPSYLPQIADIFLDLPDRKRARAASSLSAIKGYVSGEVLYFLYELHRNQVEGASLSMARKLARFNLDRKVKACASGKVLTLSDRTIFSYWEEFSSCAHLWAAKALNHYITHIPEAEIFDEKYLYDFLGLAVTFQEFATTFDSPRSVGSNGMPLPLERLWTLPADISRRLPAKIELPSLFFEKIRK